jgi:small subunit ribosomal protein S3
MGQKTHPYAFRIGVVNDWKSKWYSDHNYVNLVNEDWKIRDYLEGELLRGAVSRIDIERTRDRLIVDIHTARPGVVIGRRGSEAERLRSGLEDLTERPVKLNINEVKDPDLDAALLARGIADQLENRIAFRRAMKRAVSAAMKAGAEGVRVEAKGRLGGSEMGRREWYREGRVPLHTLRADIDFGTATAHTTVGTIGIKVWVYKGEVIETAATTDRIAAEADLATGGPARRRRQSVKSRAEVAAEGGERKPRLIEAGGGKRLVEAGGGKKEGGRRIIEAGGGRRPTAAEAQVEYEAAREDVDVEAEGVLEEAPTEEAAQAPAEPEAAEAEATTETPTEGEEATRAPEAPPAQETTEVEETAEAEPPTVEPEVPAEEAEAPPEEGPYGPGSAAPGEDGSGPEGWEVKGNANSMLFHTPDSPYFSRTKAQVWFRDEETASAAGFRRWDRKDEE